MKWAVIGCGVIGRRRAEAIPKASKLIACFDVSKSATEAFAKSFNCTPCTTSQELFQLKPDVVIVSTINAALAPSVQACMDAGIACLVEKPAARSIEELSTLRNEKNIPVKVGFNHRFHPAFKDLLSLIQQSLAHDPVMYIRGRYGNGARVGFDKEWRSKFELAGGGELLDQGVHLIDLALQICPQLEVLSGIAKTHYWDMPVDDNAWALLSATSGETFSMHVSSTEWKNEFQFDVYTRKTKYTWQGLGRSYGPEKLYIYKMKPEMGPPDIECRSYDSEDLSWLEENKNFEQAITEKKAPWGNLEDARECLRRVRDIYLKSSEAQKGDSAHPLWWKGEKN